MTRALNAPCAVGRGLTIKVTSVRDGDVDYPMLAQFPPDYRVFTVDAERPHPRLVWLVGLRDFRVVEETDETSDRAA